MNLTNLNFYNFSPNDNPKKTKTGIADKQIIFKILKIRLIGIRFSISINNKIYLIYNIINYKKILFYYLNIFLF